jgi:predicted ester cyclase
MKQPPSFSRFFIAIIFFIALLFTNCSSPQKKEPAQADPVEANIKMYTHVWDEIINKRNLDMFNDSNFTKDVVMHANPDVVGIDSARAYYANYLTGFSNIEFTIKDVFGQGDKLVKHWNFKGIHTGPFFGMAPTGKTVNIDGVTLVRMFDGKIAEERDFVDNLDLMTQLGLVPAQRK